MNKLICRLSTQLKAKGLMDNEMNLYIRDILRTLKLSSTANLITMNNRLRLLGWSYEVDGAIVDLVSACNEDDLAINIGTDAKESV